MRTTVKLDADVAARLKAVGQRGPGRSFKQYSQRMGLRPGINLDKALQLAAGLEDEEISRRRQPRK
jgi:hypothetical protein